MSRMIAIVLDGATSWIVLRIFLEKLLGVGGVAVLRKVFGVVLLALAVKLFMKPTGLQAAISR